MKLNWTQIWSFCQTEMKTANAAERENKWKERESEWADFECVEGKSWICVHVQHGVCVFLRLHETFLSKCGFNFEANLITVLLFNVIGGVHIFPRTSSVENQLISENSDCDEKFVRCVWLTESKLSTIHVILESSNVREAKEIFTTTLLDFHVTISRLLSPRLR